MNNNTILRPNFIMELFIMFWVIASIVFFYQLEDIDTIFLIVPFVMIIGSFILIINKIKQKIEINKEELIIYLSKKENKKIKLKDIKEIEFLIENIIIKETMVGPDRTFEERFVKIIDKNDEQTKLKITSIGHKNYKNFKKILKEKKINIK